MTLITKHMKERADQFIIDWRGITSERAESQTFINEFFEIFDLSRKDYAQFEKPIRKKNDQGIGFADLLWTGKLLIEAKSAFKDNNKKWDKTLEQAKEYIESLFDYQRPQYILLINFKKIQKYIVEQKRNTISIRFVKDVLIEDLSKYLSDFEFFIEFANKLEEDEKRLNEDAARKFANVYDAIDRKGYQTEELSILFARILFCLFAEDSGIFDNKAFETYIKNHTTGKTLGEHLIALFSVLNTPVIKRRNINKELSKFPYVNGELFKVSIKNIPSTNDAVRNALLDCCNYDWLDISPVIFGSLFQEIMEGHRRELGAHFTSEKNILKLIKPLFLEDLHIEFSSIRSDKKKLEAFRKKINSLRFLDPACGCGNFLVITYRELRLLDIEIIKKQYKGYRITDVSTLSSINLNNFYGYEINIASSMIAQVAMWLMLHQMNLRLENEFGTAVPTIPLHESAMIINTNALEFKWESNKIFIRTAGDIETSFDYVLGNPPFIGKQHQDDAQKIDIERIFSDVKGAGVLDYVSCWYIKAAEYLESNKKTKVAFVSTNSIAQGEQPAILWDVLFNKYKLKIQFAHQTFKWYNEAKGMAAVHCVIIGFGKENIKEKYLFEYDDISKDGLKVKVKNINPYLVKGNDITIFKKRKPISNVPEISFGSMPNDDGHLLLTDEEKIELIKAEPKSKKWIRPLISAHEYINGKSRWCLWLTNITNDELKNIPQIYQRINLVKKHRLKSNRSGTIKLAQTPHLFGEIRQPNSDYICIPLHSSENRKYIPISFLSKENIANNSTSVIPDASKFHFGILTSSIHMAWVEYVCGRIKSDYRYSNEIVYNNYPFPKKVPKKLKDSIENAVQNIIDIREKYFLIGKSLADLYDPKQMPNDLLKAHLVNDDLVDKCYTATSFKSNKERITFLFDLYENY